MTQTREMIPLASNRSLRPLRLGLRRPPRSRPLRLLVCGSHHRRLLGPLRIRRSQSDNVACQASRRQLPRIWSLLPSPSHATSSSLLASCPRILTPRMSPSSRRWSLGMPHSTTARRSSCMRMRPYRWNASRPCELWRRPAGRMAARSTAAATTIRLQPRRPSFDPAASRSSEFV